VEGLWQEGKNGGDDGGWPLISPDGVAPSRIVGVSASDISPCTIKVQTPEELQKKLSSGTCSHGWSWKKGCKTEVYVCV